MAAPQQLTDRPWHEMATIRLRQDEELRRSEKTTKKEPLVCDLSAMMSMPGDGMILRGDDDEQGSIALHAALLDDCWRRVDVADVGRRLEAAAKDGETIAWSEELEAGVGQAYAGGVSLRRHLLDLADSGRLSDGTVKTTTRSFSVHRNILALRSQYFAAAFRRSERLDLPACLDDSLVSPLLRYVYTNYQDDLDFLLDEAWAEREGEDGEREPGPVRLLYALDALMLPDATSAAVDRLSASVTLENAPSLLAVASRIAPADKLRTACFETLFSDLEAAKRSQYLSEEVKNTLCVLKTISDTNPVGRGVLTDVREALGMLRESLDEQTERLAAASLRQQQQPSGCEEDDRRVIENLKLKSLRLGYLRDYVRNQEDRLFGGDRSSLQQSCARRLGENDDENWCYEWRPIRGDAVPAGLEVRLVFGGGRTARIPPVWRLRLRLPTTTSAYSSFSRQVTQTTTVDEILLDAQEHFVKEHGVRVDLVLVEGETRLPGSRAMDSEMWKRRHRLRLCRRTPVD